MLHYWSAIPGISKERIAGGEQSGLSKDSEMIKVYVDYTAQRSPERKYEAN